MQVCRTRTATGTAIRNILFATDFSEESAHAIQYVRTLQRGYNARIFVVHVADIFPYSLSSEPSALEKAGILRNQAETRLRDFMLVHRFERKHFEPVVLTGEVFQAVDTFADEHEIDVIVIGSRGDLGFNRLFLGSTAEEIFRTARCPVLTVGPHAAVPHNDGRFHRLLFATDLSAHSKAALPYVEYLLTRDASAKVSLLHVLPHVSHPLEQELTVPLLEAELRNLIAPDLQNQINAVLVQPGEPELAIPETAASLGADLLILGVRYGGSFLRAATHGFASITNAVISKAPAPVLTIRSSQLALADEGHPTESA